MSMTPNLSIQHQKMALVLGTQKANDLLNRYGSPLYVYNLDEIRKRYKRLRSSLDDVGLQSLRIHYALKANHNLDVISTLAEQGAGADIVSWGEWHRSRASGVPSDAIIYSGVGKRKDELLAAMRNKIGQINIESESEAQEIFDLAAKHQVDVPPLLIRYTPEVMGAPHPYIATAHALSKFGLLADDTHRLIADHPEWRSSIKGIAVHIGSQITDIESFRQAFTALKDMAAKLEKAYDWKVERIDLGGGLGISPDMLGDNGLDLTSYASLIAELFGDGPSTIAIEPGRYLVAEAGLLLTRVIRRKRTGTQNYIIVDAGMNDLLRPSLYKAHHPIVPDVIRTGEKRLSSIIGPVCESADVFCRDIDFPPVEVDDALWIGHAGAYTSVLASNYNARDRLAEVVIENGEARLSRPAITDLELMTRERDGAKTAMNSR